KYRFFSVRDEFPALYPVAEGGQPVLGELYDVPMGPLNALLATEPAELELSIIELEGGELSFAMVLREAEHALGIHKDITGRGGCWPAGRPGCWAMAGAGWWPAPRGCGRRRCRWARRSWSPGRSRWAGRGGRAAGASGPP